MKKAVKKKARVQALDDSGMTGQELWTKLQKLGFTQMGFARAIAMSDRTVRKWIGGGLVVPTIIAVLVNLMIKTKSNPEDLKV